jgi:hypothetical protein
VEKDGRPSEKGGHQPVTEENPRLTAIDTGQKITVYIK